MIKKSDFSYLIFSLSIACLIFVEWEAAKSFYDKWSDSGTYAHGFLVIPICLYIVYSKWHVLKTIAHEPYKPALFLLVLCSTAAYLGNLASVQIVQQFALVGMIHALVLAVFGRKYYSTILFPMLYLFFAVPFGHFIVTTLQDFTANFAAWGLKASGLTVYHDKWFISTTRGDFQVAEACSGVRYLIASIALSTIFSYFAFQSYKKRAYFLALAIVLPILANAVRAYLIILIAHITYLKMAVGIDHIIYGWIFFGVVMAVLFWIGAKFADPIEGTPKDSIAPTQPMLLRTASWQVLSMCTILTSPFLSHIFTDQKQVPDYTASIQSADWISSAPPAGWSPRFEGSQQSEFKRFARSDGTYVDVYFALFGKPQQGKEAISELNVPFDKKVWSSNASLTHTFRLNQDDYNVEEHQIHNLSEHEIVWQWYEILGIRTSHPLVAKSLEAIKMIIHKNEPTIVMLVGTPYQFNPDEGREKIKKFMLDAKLEVAIKGKSE